MDTRTPRRPLLGGGTSGIEADPGLGAVKVPSDPARLSSTQASFRLRLATPVAPLLEAPTALLSTGAAFGDPYAGQGLSRRPLVTPQVIVPVSAVPALAGAGGLGGGARAGSGGARRKGRVTAVTWTGQASPDDLAATRLLDAVRLTGAPTPVGAGVGAGVGGRSGGAGGAGGVGRPGLGDPLAGLPEEDTQVLPPYAGSRTVPRQPRQGGGTATEAGVGPVGAPQGWTPSGELPEISATGGDSRHAWYPGRRVDLGLVLLPLRVVLGSLSVYAGFNKLCDPVYFDGGERGSMMRWLSSLHPWKVAEPLLDFAMAHPVGSGLAVAFTEIVVGVLTVLGLWQRLAAGAAMLLSAALLFTVSWRAVPVYDTPDLIFLAAWSPLLIAGAPFCSLDGRLNLEAWRRYGSGAPAALRRRVLRRGAVVTAVVVGLTLLLGSLLGAAVRTGSSPQPAPTRPATDYGTPVWPGAGPSGTPGHSAPPAAPSPAPSRPATPTPSGSAGGPSTAPASPKAGPATPSGKTKSGKPDNGTATAPAGSAPAGGGASPAPRTTGAPGTGTAPKPTPSGGSGLLGGVLGSGPLGGLAAGSDRAPRPDAGTAT